MFGDVIAIYTSADNLVAKYTYDTWGKLLSIMDANESDISSTSGIWLQNSIRYRGYVYDNETGWYYLQSRYYDPEICRFINADGLLVANNNFSINLFSYAECNPLVNIDPTGTCPYNGSMGDFRRLEMGLPSMDCVCAEKTADRINNTTSAIETGVVSYFDEMLSSIIKNASIPLNSGLDDIYAALGLVANSMGLVSILVGAIDIVWDYNTYKDDPDSFWTSTNINIISTGLSMIAVATIAVCEWPVATAFVFTVAAGIGISWIESKMRKKYLNE